MMSRAGKIEAPIWSLDQTEANLSFGRLLLCDRLLIRSFRLAFLLGLL